MEIIYHCYGGTHSSVLAAARHTGLVMNNKSVNSQLFQIPFFDCQDRTNQGYLYFFAKDENGNRVYVIGRRWCHEALSLVLGGAKGEPLPSELLLINTFCCVPWLLRLAGYLSRRLGLSRFTRPLLLLGMRQADGCIRELVFRVKLEITG